jgi:hypothetical protein
MTKDEFINILADTDLSNKEELEALYDSLKGEFIDKAVDYFCKNWFPTKSVMFDKLAIESIKRTMTDNLEELLQ